MSRLIKTIRPENLKTGNISLTYADYDLILSGHITDIDVQTSKHQPIKSIKVDPTINVQPRGKYFLLSY